MRYFTLATFSLLLACAPLAPVDPPTRAPLFAHWGVHFIVSGGIAGMSQTLLVTSDRGLIARDLRRGAKVEQHLDERAVQDIAQALSALKEQPPSAGMFPGRCRDCFNYEVQAVLDGERRYVRLSSEQLQESPYRDLVKVLSETLRRALSG